MSRKPLLSSGKLGADYELLFKYWELARAERPGAENDVVLKNEYLNFVERRIEESQKIKLEDIMNELISVLMSKVDPVIAAKAYKERYGIEAAPAFAAREISKVVATWVIEALEIEGKLRISAGRS